MTDLKPNKDRTNITPGKVFSDGSIIEQCWDGSKVYYYYFDPNGNIKDEDQHVGDNGFTYAPISEDIDILEKKILLLPTYPANYESETKLLRDVQRFIHQWCEIDLDTERLLAGYVMLTWIKDKCPTMPIINARGRSGTGKSRLLEALRQICYRGMRASGCLSLSSMFRTEGRWKGTLCINEGDLKNSSETSDIVKYLNERYEKGGNVWRTNPENLKSEYFDAFGPTIVTTRYQYKDDALESRCFTILMKERTRRDIYLNLPEEFRDAGASLRNQLLSFRFRRLGGFTNDYTLEFDGLSPRMNQILQPLASLAKEVDADLYQELVELALHLQDRMIEAMAETPEGQIFSAFLDLEESGEDSKIAFTPKEISERIALNGGDLPPTSVGIRMIPLGFELRRTGRKRLYSLPDDAREGLKRRFIPREHRVGDTFDKCDTARGGGYQKSLDISVPPERGD